MTDDLTSWLRAQLDDDERLAREAAMWTSPAWRYGEYPAEADHVEVAEHIARHDPARVLAEVDAKRRILADIIPLIDGMDAQIEAEFGTGGSHPAESEQLLRLLALPYADRPGYREVRTS